ncbi:MAG: hypothetical protein KC502_12375 [Myxococcales bacterium]|nr:hypothetical protein [Myxococcales bacterium]
MSRVALAMSLGLAGMLLSHSPLAQRSTREAHDRALNAQRVEQAAAAVASMEARLKDATKDHLAALKDENSLKPKCIDGPLRSLRRVVRLARKFELRLKAAAAQHDRHATKLAYIKVSTVLSKAETYYGELKGCGGWIDGQIRVHTPIGPRGVEPKGPLVNATEGTRDLPYDSGYVSSVSPFFVDRG